ncbi:MAG: hypothetical protein H7A06_05475 [Pseudomonadales bacterium]|nr:hypothetical protein [Pseudomonadales bacterium]
MRYTFFTLMLLMVMPTPALSQSTANFSGVWLTSAGNYISVHQNGSTIIAATLGVQASTGGVWEAMQGTVIGQTGTASTIYGYVNATYTIRLVSPTSFVATQVSCSPLASGFLCAYPNGTQLTATKVF